MNLEALCKEAELSFYDDELVSENGKKIYRIYVQKEGGVNLDDCAKLSEILSPIFDVEPPVNGEYFLEVSSPGLERILRKDKHFEKQIGNEISLKLFKPINKQKELIGILQEYNNDELTIKVEDETLKINLKDIAIAKTVFNW